MKPLATTPSLVEQVRRAILNEITVGRLPPGARIIQEQIASGLGVSRQPVQQALVLLRQQGVLGDAPGRGLIVAPLEIDRVRHMYDVRAALESLAFRCAAERNAARARAEGPAYIKAGRKALRAKQVSDMVSADVAFHGFIYELSGNPLIAPAMDTHWTQAQRVIGAVLTHEDKPRDVWVQHEALLEAVAAGDGRLAAKLAGQHIAEAGDFMIERLEAQAA